MNTLIQRTRYGIFAAILAINGLSGCKKFVQIEPTTAIFGSSVYSNNSSAAAVMTGLYTNMTSSPGLSSGDLSMGYLTGLAADELTNFDATNLEQVQFYHNALSSSTNGIPNYYCWKELYQDIYITNAVIAGVSNSNSLSSATRQQLIGEAKFMRAFFHFYATNLYGDVPLVTTTNYLVNNTISRTPQAQVYQQIIADLQDAQSKLSPNFLDASGNTTTERTRPNRGAATALLARVYLYYANLGNAAYYTKADSAASAVITNANYSLDASLNQVFLANSTEAIWQLYPEAENSYGYDTYDAVCYILYGPPSPGTTNTVAVSPQLLQAFESGDARYTNWIGSITSGGGIYYYPFKYQVGPTSATPPAEYTMVLRLAEQYLIRAEAKAEQGNNSEALADLNVIRNRAGLPNSTLTPASTQAQILAAILHERQVELFSEWGHRWFDLKRTGNLNSVMGAPGNVCQAKGGTWKTDWALLPIALQELQINHNLKQNPGY